MPRSKRNKTISLTKTNAKGKDHKQKLIEKLREAVDEFQHIYVFSFENLRENQFTEVRKHWRESRLFLGKHTVAQVALGRTPEEEFKDNLYNVSQTLRGDVGLLFTSRDQSEVLEYFNSFSHDEYAKAGAVLDRDIVVPIGPLPNASAFPAAMIDQFRKLGMVVEVEDSIITLREHFVAARKGVPLTPEQAKTLTHFGIKTVKFSITLMSHWTAGEFEEL